MIVSMQKYYFLIYHQEFQHFLEELMELGVVHVVEREEITDEETLHLARRIQQAEGIQKRLERRKVTPVPKDEEDIDETRVVPALFGVLDLEEELQSLHEQQQQYRKEIQMLSPWGDFPFESQQKLKRMGLIPNFYTCPKGRFQQEWAQDHPLEVINDEHDHVHFIIFHREGETPPELSIVEATLPRKSLSEAEELLEDCETRMAAINRLLDYYAGNFLDWLKTRIGQAKDHLMFQRSKLGASRSIEDRLVVLEGYCPQDKQEGLEAFLDQQQLVYIEGLEEEEQPPVLLKNNWFAKLFEPIGNLYSLPSYGEMDLTPYFAPFFLLFFGFCLGDMGYGLTIVLAASLAKLKADKSIFPYLTLAQFFGASTLVVGFFSGTLFGIEMVKISALQNISGLFLAQDQLFNLALVIGFLQILFGISIKMVKNYQLKGLMHALSPLGWLFLLLSLADLYVVKLAPAISGITVWVGLALLVLFGNPSGGPLKSILSGLGDLYGITGVMGDLLSYVRLFALGVSSAILGLVVNSIAQSMFDVPYVGWLIGILFAIVGHSANMMLAGLSAFVHPMRLTFVEFYKNAGFEGGGKPYVPLARKAPPPSPNHVHNPTIS